MWITSQKKRKTEKGNFQSNIVVGIGTPRWTKKLKQSGPNSLKTMGSGREQGWVSNVLVFLN